MKLIIIDSEFTVCKLKRLDDAPLAGGFTFLSVTDEEISLVCESSRVPADVLAAEPGWRMMKIQGPLDFGMVGVLARISGILADAGISLFAVSTFNTDYILLKSEDFELGAGLLGNSGYTID